MPSPTPDSTTGKPAGYRERLWVPWWWWPVTFAVVALLSAEIGLGAPGVKSWLPYAILLPAAAAALWWAGRLEVAVVGDELRVDDARLPVRFVARVSPLSAEQRRELLGVLANPEAFVIQRPWVARALRIDLADPADPTPYWVVSSRRPEQLTAAIRGAGQSSDSAPG